MWGRDFEAHGGWNTAFFAAFMGYSAHHFGWLKAKPLHYPLQTQAGVRSLFINAAIIAGPTLFGYVAGISAFGDWKEVRNISTNYDLYRDEARRIHKELYTYN